MELFVISSKGKVSKVATRVQDKYIVFNYLKVEWKSVNRTAKENINVFILYSKGVVLGEHLKVPSSVCFLDSYCQFNVKVT